MRLPSWSYPPPIEDGYWLPHTSTILWCEEKYYATRYSAEIINSLTNLTFIILAFKGMYNCYKNGHDKIFFITFFGYLIVGSGSFAFHSTLKYPMQLVDELSMIYTTCLMAWASFGHKRSLGVRIALGVAVGGLALFITLYYHYLQDPSFHQNAYAILTAVVLFRSMFIMEQNIRPHFRKRKEERANGSAKGKVDLAEVKRQDDRDTAILKTMWLMIAMGLSIFLGGFGIWTLDNVYCSKLQAWRHEIGLPWGILLEGHGWWHLMTGVGAYFYIVWGIWLRHCINGRQDEFEAVWPSVLTSLPRIERSNKRIGTANGHAKKAN